MASESSGSLTEGQPQRVQRNEQLASERRQARLSDSRSPENDLLLNTSRAPTADAVNAGEDQKKESDGLNKDIPDNPHSGAAANTVNEEEELTPDRCF